MNTTPKATLNPGKPLITKTETVVIAKGEAPTVTDCVTSRVHVVVIGNDTIDP